MNLAGRLSRDHKDVLLKVYREAAWWLKWLPRAWRRAGIEGRLPAIPGRTWRTAIPPRLHISLTNGAINYTYRGIRMIKNPIDLALYQKLLFELKPRTVIEIGSKDGGTACWFGDHMNLFGLRGMVVSIDINPPNRPYCCPENVTFLRGDEASLGAMLFKFDCLPHPWLVINDASHSAPAMLRCFNFLHRLLKKDDYLIVEDGFLTEAGLDWDGERKGGPGLAIARFLETWPSLYAVDARYCDHFGKNVTANPNGYIKRL